MPIFMRSSFEGTPLNYLATISSIESNFSDNAQLEQNIHRLNLKDIQYLEFAEINSINSLPHNGQVVQESQTIAQIPPTNASLVPEAVLLDTEADFVCLEMPVQIKLDAYLHRDYSIISSQVTSIPANAKPS